MPAPVTDASFGPSVLQSDKPVLVDFWAQWCGPCKAIAPILDDLEGEMGDRLSIQKLNVDESPNMTTEYSIRSIPTLMLFKDGKIAGKKVGAVSKGDLKSWIESHI